MPAVSFDSMARRLPHHALPTTTFVAGRSPRPPEGWAHTVSPDEAFAYGCDLFDAGCYFEAHELWERCWLRARADAAGASHDDEDDDVRLLRGLIHLAAAGVKLLDEKPDSRRRHVERGAALWNGTTAAQHARGLPPGAVDAAAADLAAGRRPTLG